MDDLTAKLKETLRRLEARVAQLEKEEKQDQERHRDYFAFAKGRAMTPEEEEATFNPPEDDR